MCNSEEDIRPRHSINSNEASYVEFCSRTGRKVDILWLDYQGKKVKYATLQPGQRIFVDTFVTHPWVFRDSETYDVLVANNREKYFYPPPYDEETMGDEQRVTIDTPGRCITRLVRVKEDFFKAVYWIFFIVDVFL